MPFFVCLSRHLKPLASWARPMTRSVRSSSVPSGQQHEQNTTSGDRTVSEGEPVRNQKPDKEGHRDFECVPPVTLEAVCPPLSCRSPHFHGLVVCARPLGTGESKRGHGLPPARPAQGPALGRHREGSAREANHPLKPFGCCASCPSAQVHASDPALPRRWGTALRRTGPPTTVPPVHRSRGGPRGVHRAPAGPCGVFAVHSPPAGVCSCA